MSTIIIRRELDPGTEGAIAITAAEGGIGYWSQIDTYRPSRWCDDEYVPNEQADDFVFYTIHEDLDDDGTYAGPPIDITSALIRRGMQLFLDGAFGFAGRMFDDMEDLAAMDAAEADCVIQLGCFGTLIYG